MSKRLLKKPLASIDEFGKATRRERLFIHLMEPERFPLNNQDSVYLERMKRIFLILSGELSRKRAQKKILETMPMITPNHVYKMIRDCESLYGEILKTNKDFDRAILREKFIKLARKAHKEKEYETERLCYVNIMKLGGLDDYTSENGQPLDLEIPQAIFSADPNILEIDYEEINQDE